MYPFVYDVLFSQWSMWLNDFESTLSLQNIARKTKRSRPANLKDLLLLAVNRMMFQGVSTDCYICFDGDS